MGQSFEDKEDSGLITKKFWSYAKATANTTRIPELVLLANSFKSNPLDQAHLINFHFYNQSSEIKIIVILCILNRFQLITCVFTLEKYKSLSLSLLFTKSYYSGNILEEWKSDLVE